MRKTITLAGMVMILLTCGINTYAQLGKDGAKIITGTVTNSNEYTTLTADAAAGNTSIAVASCSLNSGGNFSGPLGAGDLIMIIQMQGATLNSATDSTWGSIINYNNCGNYEFAEVLNTAGSNTINLNCGLQNNYSASGRTQVIRVPRYISLTVNTGATLSCPAWNAATGGILAVEVSGNTVINGTGTINVNGLGFRGGQLSEDSSWFGVLNFVWPDGFYGAEKGEGIGGFEGDYAIYGGMYCKGAAANGAGGGNAHNAGGGGGANGGDPAAWAGKGNPNVSNASWIAAWNLEYAGFASSSSSGGGRGGYTSSWEDENPLVTGPNNSVWQGDNRDNNGGWGGRPLDYSTGRIFLGGGGGAGQQDNNCSGAGGSGGGLFYLMNYGTLSGSGTITANGVSGGNTRNSTIKGGIDGAGGAGAGGTIILNSLGAISGISATANGGSGGNQSVSLLFDPDEAEGPGGGGGGGYIATSNGSITLTAAGGANGTTNSVPMASFPADGATEGGSGTTNGVISNFSLAINNVTACYGSSVNLNVTVNGNLPAGTTIYWYDVQFGGTVLGSGANFATPVLTAAVTYYVGACPGTYRLPVTITIDSVVSNFIFSSSCNGTPVIFNSSGAYSKGGTINQWSWNFGDGSGMSSQPNPSYQYSTGGPYSVSLTVTDNAGCSASISHSINVGAAPAISFSANKTTGCDSLSVQFTNNTTNGQTYHWNFGDGDSSSLQSPLHDFNSPGSYTIILSATSSGGCIAVDTINKMIAIGSTPSAGFTYVANCSNYKVQFTDVSTGVPTSWSWNFGDGSGTSSQQNATHSYASNGNYNVTLTVVGTYGCIDSVSKNIGVYTSPVISFDAISSSGCDSLNVQFTNNTTNALSYFWYFGDGDTSSQQAPLHDYLSPGSYTVILRASNSGCSSADTIVNMITISETPVANFSYVADCGSGSVQLTDSSKGNVTSWNWNFGDGIGTSSQQDPLYIYNNDTTYNIRLVVSNSAGCKDTVVKTVTLSSPPDISFSANNVTGCDSVSVAFHNNTTNAVSYNWDFGDGSFSTDTNPVHLYTKAGIYNVTLTAVSPGGCSVAQYVINMVTVDSAPASPMIYQNGDSLTSDSASSYQWYLDSTAISGATHRIYIPSKNGSYFVLITSSNGCSSKSASIHVVLNGIAEQGSGHATFYPNPVTDFLQINFQDLTATPLKAELTDILGKMVWNESSILNSKTLIIDMTKMTKSVYFLTLYYRDRMTVSKIIKQ